MMHFDVVIAEVDRLNSKIYLIFIALKGKRSPGMQMVNNYLSNFYRIPKN